MTAKATLIAAAWMVGEPIKGFWTSDVMRYINNGGGGMFEEPKELLYPAAVRKRCEQLRDAGYLAEISWGRYHITGTGWRVALKLTGGRGLL